MQQRIFIADLIAYSTCFGHHYAHHQELESIIQVVAASRVWCLVFKLSVWCGAEGCVSGLLSSRTRMELLLESCLQTCMTYTIAECTVNKLLMMDRGTVRNM